MSADGGLVFCTKEPSDRRSSDGTGWIHRVGAERRNGHAPPNGVPTTRYAVVEANGALAAVHCRVDRPATGKRMWWELPDGRKGLDGRRPETLPLYHAAYVVVEAPPGAVVFVCEGEKAADAVRDLGLHAVGTVTGAAATPSDATLAALVGYDVVLWPDNDDAGRQHMQRIARRLVALGTTPRLLTWPDAPEKGDAADFVARGLGKDELRALYAAAEIVADTGSRVNPAGVVEHRLADLEPEEVRWLWPGRIPFAKITVLDGDPGLGKSTITLDLAARVTRGERMPDEAVGDTGGPGSVLLLTAEDGLRDTVLPRLLALGADLERVFALESVLDAEGRPAMPAIPRDLDAIEERIVAHGVVLIVVDPLIAFLGDSSETNTWRDQDIRRALGPFAQMLERRGCAAVAVRHLNKGAGGNPIYRGGGSIGIIGAARSGLLVQKDPDDDTGQRRILAMTKANLAAPARSLAYRMESAANGSVTVVWLGETEHTAIGLLAEPLPEEERTAIAEAVDFLKAELYGNPITFDEIKRKARASDISDRTLRRARARLRVVAERLHGPTGPWSLRLPVLKGTAAAEKHGADE